LNSLLPPPPPPPFLLVGFAVEPAPPLNFAAPLPEPVALAFEEPPIIGTSIC